MRLIRLWDDVEHLHLRLKIAHYTLSLLQAHAPLSAPLNPDPVIVSYSFKAMNVHINVYLYSHFHILFHCIFLFSQCITLFPATTPLMYALFISNQSIYILRLRAAVCILPRSGGDRGKRLNKKVQAQNYSAEESSESLELQSFMDIFIQMTFRDIRRLEIMIFSSN